MELKSRNVQHAQNLFDCAVTLEFYGDDEEQVEKAQAVFSAFAKMETWLKEYEQARVIYKVCLFLTLIYSSTDFFLQQFALSRIPQAKSMALYATYTKFKKQHGTRSTLENTVLGKCMLYQVYFMIQFIELFTFTFL